MKMFKIKNTVAALAILGLSLGLLTTSTNTVSAEAASNAKTCSTIIKQYKTSTSIKGVSDNIGICKVANTKIGNKINQNFVQSQRLKGESARKLMRQSWAYIIANTPAKYQKDLVKQAERATSGTMTSAKIGANYKLMLTHLALLKEEKVKLDSIYSNISTLSTIASKAAKVPHSNVVNFYLKVIKNSKKLSKSVLKESQVRYLYQHITRI